MTESYEDVAEKALNELRKEMGSGEIKSKKMRIYT